MKTVLVTGFGRSGTKFIAKKLDILTNVTAKHESMKNFKAIYFKTHNDSRLSKHYDSIINNCESSVYVEVDSHFRNRIDSAIKCLRNPSIFILVRDGRDVVSSVMNRKVSPHVRQHINRISPKGTWLEKICRYWSHDMVALFELLSTLKIKYKYYEFEKFTKSTGYLKLMLEDITGVQITNFNPDMSKVNERKINRFKWTSKLLKVFESNAGAANRLLGYEDYIIGA